MQPVRRLIVIRLALIGWGILVLFQTYGDAQLQIFSLFFSAGRPNINNGGVK